MSIRAEKNHRPAGTCDCGAALPTVGVQANGDGMALSAGETPALVLVNCTAPVHGSRPRTFALAIARAA